VAIKAALIQRLVNKAMTKQLGDLAESATYISIVSVYDETDSTTTETRTEVSVSGVVFYSKKDSLALYSRFAARGSVDVVESTLPQLAAVFPVAQLPSTTPKVNDVLKRAASLEYTIESIAIDPVSAVYLLGLRLP